MGIKRTTATLLLLVIASFPISSLAQPTPAQQTSPSIQYPQPETQAQPQTPEASPSNNPLFKEVTPGSAPKTPSGLHPFGYDFFERALPSALLRQAINKQAQGQGKAPSPAQIPYPEISAPEGLAVPVDYIPGPGDTLHVVITSSSGRESHYDTTVNGEGEVYLQGLGLFPVSGHTVGELEKIISERLLERFGRSLSAFVSVTRIHAIRVYVAGEAVRPGSYTLSGLSTPIDALYAAGGPSLLGSMRDIRVIRNNRVVAVIDFYRYLLQGKISPISLASDDTILIAPRGPVVGIQGEVLRPALYEMKGKETLGDLLELAGGALPTGYSRRVRIDRIVNGENRVIVEAGLHEKNVRLASGDMVTVFSVLPEISNGVRLTGMVSRPGTYGFSPGMRVSDLFRLGGGLLPQAARRAEIGRMSNGTVTIIPVNLGEALSEPGASADIPLRNHDTLYVTGIADFHQWAGTVTLEGEVAHPGAYPILSSSETLSDVIARAGGLTQEAFPYGAVFMRELPRIAEQSQLEKAGHIQDYVQMITDQFTKLEQARQAQKSGTGGILLNSTLGSITATSVGPVTAGGPRKLHEILSTGRIPIDLEKIMATKGRVNVPLVDGDALYIPKKPRTVVVAGATYSPSALLFEPGKSVWQYIHSAGGFATDADEAHPIIIHPNGEVYKANRNSPVALGDIILIPTKVLRLDPTGWEKFVQVLQAVSSGFLLWRI